MKSTQMLNKIKTLLDIQIKLEEMKLENGTRVEAESFEKGKEIFIMTDDEKVCFNQVSLSHTSSLTALCVLGALAGCELGC